MASFTPCNDGSRQMSALIFVRGAKRFWRRAFLEVLSKLQGVAGTHILTDYRGVMSPLILIEP